MKKFILLSVFALSVFLVSAQPKTTLPADSSAFIQKDTVTKDTTAVLEFKFIVGTDADFKVLESIVANFRGASFAEIEPVLRWLQSRQKLPTEPVKDQKSDKPKVNKKQ